MYFSEDDLPNLDATSVREHFISHKNKAGCILFRVSCIYLATQLLFHIWQCCYKDIKLTIKLA